MQDNSDRRPWRNCLAPRFRDAYRSTMEDASPDHDERIKDFYARHGGPGPRGMRTGQSSGGVQGWSEAHASDGYVLRCDWSTFGSHDEMQYSEIAPKA
jgi:hypothetical protein